MAENPLPVAATFILLLTPTTLAATPDRLFARQSTDAVQTPPAPQQGTGQRVAEGEEPAKPTRSFFPALAHNLVDDVKHIPRRNSLYWLAAGTGLSLAVHHWTMRSTI